MSKKIEEMTEIELKALLSDERDRFDICSHNIKVIRKELQSRKDKAENKTAE